MDAAGISSHPLEARVSPTAGANFGDVMPTFGSARLVTSGTTNDGAVVELGHGGPSGIFNGLNTTAGWDSEWRFKLGQTTATSFAIGFLPFQTSAFPTGTTQGVYLRYDTGSDSTFKFCTGNGTVANCVDTGISPDTNWHSVRIRSAASGTFIFTLYAGDGTVQRADTLTATDIPTAALNPVVVLITRSASPVNCSLDYFDLKQGGLRLAT